MSGVDIGSGDRASREFRPALEGLRAVAVGLVLLFHADIPPFRGGYVGVDVFFVLSGFLITGLLVRELESTGRIALPAFYARRARRLLPAAVLVLIVTAVAAVLLLPPLRIPGVAIDIASAAGYVSNIRFALQATDYLQSDMPPSPVLHYWSLGVEEQFYLFWPALLALVAGGLYAVGDHLRATRRITLVLATVFVASLALSVWLTGIQQPLAFFLLPTRAWELALGGLLAMPAAARVASVTGARLGWIGVGLVVASGIVLDSSTPFPGTAAIFPALGCALVIAGDLRGSGSALDRRIPGPAWLLSWPPLRYVGRISYSLYLWHWPVLVLPAMAFGPLSATARLGLIGLAIVLAAVSQRWVEEPIRKGRLVGTEPSRVLAAAGALSLVAVLAATGLAVKSEAGLQATGPRAAALDIGLPPIASASPDRAGAPSGPRTLSPLPPSLPPLAASPVPADLVPALVDARDDLPVIYRDGCHASPSVGSLPAGCTFGDSGSSRVVALFGDSHAAQWFPTLERLATERHWRLVSLTKSACASASVNVWIQLYNRPYTECETWRDHVFELLADLRPALVVVSNDRNYTIAIDGRMAYTTDHEDIWAAGLADTIGRLTALGSKVVVIGDTVRQASDPLDCLSAHLDDASACSTPYALAVDTPHAVSESNIAASAGATFIDPRPAMCPNEPCPSVIGRFLIYRDTHHLTATFARALAPWLFALLPAIR